jgi:recombination protein RecT
MGEDLQQPIGLALVPSERADQLKTLLESRSPVIENAIPNALRAHLDPRRVAALVVSAFARTPKLYDCTKISVLSSIVQAAQLGLEIDMLGQAYLIPFKKECQLVPGYRGLMKLAYQSGEVSHIMPQTVYDDDQHFYYQRGLDEKLEHDPRRWNYQTEEPDDPSWREANRKLIAVYAIAALRDGNRVWHVMERPQIEGIRKRSPYGREWKGPWKTDYPAMAMKSAIRHLAKFVPASTMLQIAARAVEMHEVGMAQQLHLEPQVAGALEAGGDDVPTEPIPEGEDEKTPEERVQEGRRERGEAELPLD